jgi:hypothetical protein
MPSDDLQPTPAERPDAVMRAIRDQVRASLDVTGAPLAALAEGRRAVAASGRAWRDLRHKLYLASEHHAVRELPFESSTPVVGRLIVALRTVWNNVACKWHVRKLLIQQNAYNLDVLQTLQSLAALAQQQEERIAALEAELAALRAPDDAPPAP